MIKSRAQASVLTVAIMIVMVVFSIYAMTEYSIVVQTPYTVASTLTGNSSSSVEILSAPSSISSFYTTGCAQGSFCGRTSSVQGLSSSQSAAKVAGVVSGGATSGNAVVACPIIGEGRLILTAVADSTHEPLKGVVVQASDTVASCSNQKSTLDLGKETTNSSGMVTLCCNVGSYSMDLNYETSVYTASANVSSGGLTCISFFIPSGKITITYSAIVQDLCNRNSS